MKATLVINLPEDQTIRDHAIREICKDKKTFTVADLTAFDLFGKNPVLNVHFATEDVSYIVVDDVDFDLTSTKSTIMGLVRASALHIHRPVHPDGCLDIEPHLVFITKQPLEVVMKCLGNTVDIPALFSRLVIGEKVAIPKFGDEDGPLSKQIEKMVNEMRDRRLRPEGLRPIFPSGGMDYKSPPPPPPRKPSSAPIHAPLEFAVNNLDKAYEDLKDLIKTLWPAEAKLSYSLIILDALSALVKEAAAGMRLIDNQTKIPTGNGATAGL